MKNLIVFLMCFNIGALYAQKSNKVKWFDDILQRHNLDGRYILTKHIKPTYLEADFNGDGITDLAALLTEITNSKVKIVLVDGRTKKHFLIDSSNSIFSAHDSSSNVNWISGWKVYSRKIAYETTFNKAGDITGSIKRSFKNNAIYIWASEGGVPIAGKIIVWDGKKFRWIHQGD